MIYDPEIYLENQLKRMRQYGHNYLEKAVNTLERHLADIRRMRDEFDSLSDYDKADRLRWTAQAFVNIGSAASLDSMGEVAGQLQGLSSAHKFITNYNEFLERQKSE